MRHQIQLQQKLLLQFLQQGAILTAGYVFKNYLRHTMRK